MSTRFSRRQFLKLGALIAGGMATLGAARSRTFDELARAVGDTAARLPLFRANAQTTGELIGADGEPMTHAPAAPAATNQRRYVMVIDLAKCDGCKECTTACSAMHFVPPGQEWIKVFENRDNKVAGAYWFPRPCMQCDNTPCAKVCPVGATFKREDGIVLIDQERCIGCRYCIAACPYASRYFNWAEPPHTSEELAQKYSVELNYPHRKGVVEKCIFCPALAREGKIPACASACRMNAIYFGDQVEDVVTNHAGETVSFTQLIREKGGFRYMEDLGTEPRVWYLPPRDRVYPAPKG
jgi:molybdopterin-containing oxidoreductase family iron-sulfur binding subunit